MRELHKLLQSFRNEFIDDGYKEGDPIIEQYDNFTDDVVKLFSALNRKGLKTNNMTKEEIDEKRALNWIFKTSGKSCRNCNWSGYEKGDLIITCGHHIQNFTSSSSCGAWVDPNDPDLLKEIEKRRRELINKKLN
jgi:hypothetical protein